MEIVSTTLIMFEILNYLITAINILNELFYDILNYNSNDDVYILN